MAVQKLTIEHIARIEGHGTVRVDVADGQLVSVEMNITEPARVFEQMVKGRLWNEVSYIASRICGICSPNHCLTSILATEDAFGVEVSEQTKVLRRLLIHGSYLQNHATHLYLLAAPDYLGQKAIFPLAQSAPSVLERALRIKKLGNDLCNLVGGRSIHPINAVVGGFTVTPDRRELEALATRLDEVVADCVETGELFSGFDAPAFKTKGDLLALTASDDYAITHGEASALLGGWKRDVHDYHEYLSEKTCDYSNARLSTLQEGRTFVVGAMARINHSWSQLTPQARIVAAKAGLRPVWLNTFKNNISQAIELVDAAQRCATICHELSETLEECSVVNVPVHAGTGIAATEAPRGTVYHELTYDDAGRVVSADILTPTAQNMANLESDIRLFATEAADFPHDEFALLIEKLIRAYDPCLSCAVH